MSIGISRSGWTSMLILSAGVLLTLSGGMASTPEPVKPATDQPGAAASADRAARIRIARQRSGQAGPRTNWLSEPAANTAMLASLASWTATFQDDERVFAFANMMYDHGKYDRAAAAYKLLIDRYGRASAFGEKSAWRYCESLAPLQIDVQEWASDPEGPIWISHWHWGAEPPSEIVETAIKAYRAEVAITEDRDRQSKALRCVAMLERHLDRWDASERTLQDAATLGAGLTCGADALWDLADGLGARKMFGEASVVLRAFLRDYPNEPRIVAVAASLKECGAGGR